MEWRKTSLLTLLALATILVAIPSADVASAEAKPPPQALLLITSFTGPQGTPPFPGENGTLRIEWLYQGFFVADRVYAVVELPEGFSPNRFSALLGAAAPGDVLVLEKLVTVSKNLPPSTYTGRATLYILVGNSLYIHSYTIELEVAKCPAGLSFRTQLTPFSYPGSNNVKLEITMENSGPGEVRNASLSLRLPEGWLPGDNITWTIDILGANESHTHTVTGVYVPPWLEPGVYNASLSLSYYCVVGNTTRYFNYTMIVPIRVDPPKPLHVEPLALGWRKGVAYPGEVSAPLDIVLVNQESYTIVGLVAVLTLPEGMRVAGTESKVYKEVYDNLAAGYGDSVSMNLRVDVDSSLAPGLYNASLQLKFIVNWQGATTVLPLNLSIGLPVAGPEQLGIRTVYAGWADGYAYPGEVSAPLRIAVQSLEDATVTAATLTLELPAGIASRGQGTVTIALDGLAARYGDTIEFTTQLDIAGTVKPGSYTANATIVFVLADEDGNKRVKYTRLPVRLDVDPPHAENITILSSRWSTWITGSEAYTATVAVDMSYWGRGRVRYIVAEVEPLQGATLRAGTRSVTVIERVDLGPGDIASLQIPGIRVSSNTSQVALALRVTAVVTSPGGGVYNVTAVRIITLKPLLEQPLGLGYVEISTAHLVPSSSSVEVTVGIVNTAPEPITIFSAEPGNTPEIHAWLTGGGCLATGAEPGSSCSIRLAVNVSRTARPGVYTIPVDIWYSYRSAAGTVVTGRQVIHVPLAVEPVEAYAPRLTLARAYWATAPGASPIHVYPGTDAAPLQLEVYNPGRYPVSGVIARIRPLDSSVEVVRQPQPCSSIAPGSSCTVTAYLRISPDAAPGPHRVVVEISYTFTQFNAHAVVNTTEETLLEIDDPDEAIYVVDVSWASTPRPGTRTALLIARIYPDPSRVSRIYSVVLELPRTLFNPQNGGNKVVAVPQNSLQYPSRATAEQQNIAALLSEISGTVAGVETYTAQVGVNATKPETAPIMLDITWIDHLGYLHTVRRNVSIHVPVAPSFMDVSVDPYAELRGGVARVNITLVNTGATPVYNVYAILVPASATGYVVSSTRYLPVLGPGEKTQLAYIVVYNPVGFGGAKSYTFTGMLTVIYEDSAGNVNTFNTSIAFIMKPVILLRFTQLEAEWHNGTIVVKGIVANEGVEPSEAVRVDVYAGSVHGSSFIGSLDPSSEAPFRIELALEEKPENVLVSLWYSDRYGIDYMLNKTVAVREAVVPAQQVKKSEEVKARLPLGVEGVKRLAIVLALVAATLAFMAYRRYKRLSVEEQQDVGSETSYDGERWDEDK